MGGKALLQWYEACNIDGSACEGSESESIPKPKRRKGDVSDKPLILVILSPLMACAHREVQQASDIVVCDSRIASEVLRMTASQL